MERSPRFGSLPRSSASSLLSSRSSAPSDPLSLLLPSSPRLLTQRSDAYDVLLDENAVLRERITVLEKKVCNQDSELMLLRASTADIIRRLSNIENGVGKERKGKSPIRNGHSPSSARAFSLSSSLSSAQSVPQRTTPLSQSLYAPSTSSQEQQERPSRRPSALVNVLVGKSARGSPMRKWMSSYDMQEHNNNPQPMSSLMSSSSNTPSLRSARTSSTQSLLSSPTTLSVPNSTTVARSTSRLSVFSGIHSSNRPLNRLSMATRDPTFNPSTNTMTVHTNGKSINIPVPDDVDDIDFHSEQSPPNGKAPQIEWVYGMSSRESRQSVHGLPTGEVVYCAGNVVVLYSQEDHTQRHYTQHTSDVTCLALHPNRILIASGQTSRHTHGRAVPEHKSPVSTPHQLERVLENEQTQAHVRIWDSVSLSTLSVLGGLDHSFDRSVSALSFSSTDAGALLACVDESFQHVLSIWDWSKKKRLAESRSANDLTVAVYFHPSLKNTLVQFGKGHFSFWTVDARAGRLEKTPAVFEGREKPKCVLCICFTEGTSVVAGDSNGSLSLWDPRTGRTSKQAHGVHPGGVFAVGSTPSGQIVSAGKERSLILWDPNDFVRLAGPVQLPDDCGPLRCVVGAGPQLLLSTAHDQILTGDFRTGFRYIVEGARGETSALSAHPHTPRLMAVSTGGLLRVWDVEQRIVLWSKQMQEGLTCCSYSHCGSLMAVGTESGRVILIDAVTRETVFEGKHSSQSISSVQFSSTSGTFALATKEPSLLLFRIDSSRHVSPSARVSSLQSPITHIDFSSDGQHIRTNTADGHLIFFNTRGVSVEGSDVNNSEWATGNCLLSYETALAECSAPGTVCSALSPLSAASSTTSTSASSSPARLALLGRSDGTTRLYTSPVASLQAGFHSMRAHGVAVRSVAFVGGLLFTASGGDSALLQWRSRP